MTLTYTDIFCGAGGSSIGLSAAGLELRLAANHWPRAIETHSANFPAAEHLCADVSNYDMRRLPRTDVLWASPICTENSPAGGRRRPRGQLALEEHGHVAAAGFERTRATFHDVIRASEVHRYAAVIVENVVEAAQWELFDWWLQGMQQLGYQVQYVSVSSAHIGGPGNQPAPQWRDRLYLVFTRAGIPLPDVDPRPAAWCPFCEQDVAARQAWKRPQARRIGKYRQQYTYRCPNTARHQTLARRATGPGRTAIQLATVEPYVLPVAAAIDWTDLGQRIGDRTRPLAPKTLRRIHIGRARYSRPFTVPAGGTWRTTPDDLALPAPTRTSVEADALVCPPLLVTTNHDDHRPYPTHAVPAPADNTRIGTALAVDGAFLAILRNNADTSPLTAPAPTLATGRHHALVIPYYRTGTAKPTTAPADTLTTHDRFALTTGPANAGDADLDDWRLRMFQPRESLRIQRFPDTYTVTGNRGEQTMQAGNAVSANVAQWLGHQLAAVLA